MNDDIVPALLEAILKDFEKNKLDSDRIRKLLAILETGNATYTEATKYAAEIGTILSKALNTHITANVLPNGQMYFNIANRIVNETLKKSFDSIVEYIEIVQTQLNDKAGIKLKAQVPDFNQNRADSIVNKLTSKDNFEQTQWILEEPIVNFTQSIVDDAVKANVEFHAQAGLAPKIVRTASGKPCQWCRSLEGDYKYPSVPSDVYHRHDNCRCFVNYYPNRSTKQNVWTKEVSKANRKKERIQRIQERLNN